LVTYITRAGQVEIITRKSSEIIIARAVLSASGITEIVLDAALATNTSPLPES